MSGAMVVRLLLAAMVLVVCGALAGQLVSLAQGDLRDAVALPVRRGADPAAAFLRDCGQQAVVEPSSIRRTCTAGSPYWANLQWSDWGGARAVARGSYLSSDCDCTIGAAATVRAYPVRVELGGLAVRSGVRQYTTMSVVFPSVRPRAITATGVHYRIGSAGFRQLDAR